VGFSWDHSVIWPCSRHHDLECSQRTVHGCDFLPVGSDLQVHKKRCGTDDWLDVDQRNGMGVCGTALVLKG